MSRVAASGLPCRRTSSTAPSALSTAISASVSGKRAVIPGASPAPAGIADRPAGAHVLLDAVLRERIAQSVFRQRFHAGDRLRQIVGRQYHLHLVVEHAAIALLGETRDRKARR